MNYIAKIVNSSFVKKLLKEHLVFNCPNCLDIKDSPCTWCMNISEDIHLPMQIPYPGEALEHFADARGY